MYLKFQIKVPAIIANLVLYFLLRYRKKKYGYEFRKIKLFGCKSTDWPNFAKVDAEDYQKLAAYDWQIFKNNSSNFYAARIEGGKIVSMHREIMHNPAGLFVDHKDRNGLNNTKQNLRLATCGQNNCNRRKKEGSSKYRGVSYCKKNRKWRASITFNGKDIWLGQFDTEEDAARAYDEAAKIYHGEFAALNFNEDSHEVTKARK